MINKANKIYIGDIETDGLDPTRIWCMSICNVLTSEIKTFTNYEDIRLFVSNSDINLAMHNGYCYDKPALEKILGVKVKCSIIDTLALSWYLYPKRTSHGLAAWGEDLGVAKPEIEDWENLSIQEYVHRCEEDVKINTKLWLKMQEDLLSLYGDDSYWNAIDYLCFKMHCVALQEKCKWKLDVDKAKDLVSMFEGKIEAAKTTLESVMPLVPKFAKRSAPAKPYKKDGELSASGLKWKELTDEHKLPFNYQGSIEVVVKYERPNAGSSDQIKNWLYSLGWEPLHHKHVRDKETGDTRKVPQVKNPDTGELCANVLIIAEQFPELNSFVELGILQHRKAVVEGFLAGCDSEGFIKASAQGFTNTLRLRHRTFVNTPSIRKPYGKEIRSLLTARSDEYELMGADMASLEDRTKQHYMWPHDPEYVKEMQKDGFDPHLDIAQEAGIVNAAEVYAYKKMSSLGVDEITSPSGNFYSKKKLSEKRHAGKGTNYAATYLAGAGTIARTANVPLKTGRLLHKAYWKRNWSLKAIAEGCTVKQSRGLNWLWNPVAQMWYWLKKDKDRFSTLNQGTGTYCFDMWIKEIVSKRKQLTGQSHDEGIWEIKKGNREQATKLLKDAVETVNSRLKLNRRLDVDVQFGDNYADIH